MLDPLKHRADKPELMDDWTEGGEELREALRHLRRLNVLFGAAGPVLYGVQSLWRAAGRPEKLTVLDIGCGSGDINGRLLKWAKQRSVRLDLILADLTEEACGEARRQFANEPSVRVVRCDLFKLPACCADIVTASQLAHHLPDDELVRAVQCMRRAARVGVVLSDIHRHPIAWLAVWLGARLLSRNRYIRHDGPLSVAKGFRAADWKRLQQASGLLGLDVSWRPLFRYAAVIRERG